MASSLGSYPNGWSVNNNVAQTSTSAQASAHAHLEAREGPAPAQWQAVKDEIRLLYEKNPLRDVRKIMERKYGFKATERMYKARLSQWGIGKNYSDKDYQICSVLNYRRQKSGKRSTAFIIHGHKRSLKDLHKYVKGRKMTEEDFLATALANVDCIDEDQQPEQYAHVRAYTPEPEVNTEDAPLPSPEPRARPADIALHTNPPTLSPAGTVGDPYDAQTFRSSVFSDTDAPGSAHPPMFTYQNTPRENRRPQRRISSRSVASPPMPLPLVTHSISPSHPEYRIRPSTAESAAQQVPTSPLSSRQHLVSSPQGTLSSRTYSAANEAWSASEEMMTQDANFQGGSPNLPCQWLGRNVGFMALQVLESPPLRSLCGHDDIRAWSLMMANGSPSEESMDYEQICPTCHESTREHFISLPNLEIPQQPRNILNSIQGTSDSALSIPSSSREHDHSWRWVARCFAACIQLRRGNQDLSRQFLAEADMEFEKMLVPRQDPKVILALNQTLTILQMHNQGDLTKSIMNSAFNVAERVLGPDDPLTVLVRWQVYVSNGQMRNRDITSTTIQQIHEQFVLRHGINDPRSIASRYCYGFMLNVEGKCPEAEQELRQVYKVSCKTLTAKHLQSISALTNLHRALQRQGRIDEAIEVLERAIKDSKDTLGHNHPRRLESIRLLALMHQEQGDLEQTEQLYWVVLRGRIDTLGKSHSYSQGMKRDLEELLKKTGKWTVTKLVPEEGGDSMVVEEVPSKEQLDIQDLFEWDASEQWEGGSDGSDNDVTARQHAAF